MPDCMISEKPMMAFSGVRNSCDMLARKSDLALLAASARSRASRYLAFNSSSSPAFCSDALRAIDRSWIVAISRRSLSISRSWCSLSCVMSEPTEIVPPLGAAFVDLQPATVGDLALEGLRLVVVLRARNALFADQSPHHRIDRLARRAGDDGLCGQAVIFLELGVAEHQTVGLVPQREGFRGVLDRRAQVFVGLGVLGGEDGSARSRRRRCRSGARRSNSSPPVRCGYASSGSARRRGACGTVWSTRRISCAAARLARANRSMSSGWISDRTSPKDRMSSLAS